MSDRKVSLQDRVARAAVDLELEAVLKRVADRFGPARRARLAELGDPDAVRERVSRAKQEALDRQAYYLDRLRDRLDAVGAKLHLARDAAEARAIIVAIAREHGARTAVKSKSMTAEEVGLNAALAAAGVEVFETDLGEYIIQLADEPPFHIVLPAIHKTRGQIGRLFAEKLGVPLTDDPETLTRTARAVLREKFLAADLGITGANAVIAENGAIALFENEGNIRLTTTLPPVHVALAGIDKLLPTMADLAALALILPRSATGQKLSTYLQVIRGPRRAHDHEGPRELHLVLLDNGRSRMLDDPELKPALKCIRCGACLNVCPVYQHVGGHAYGSVYPGPIGAMITTALAAGDEGPALPFLSSLCGACEEACSAKIPITAILLELRRRAAERHDRNAAFPISARLEQAAFAAIGELWRRPALYHLVSTPMLRAGLLGYNALSGGDVEDGMLERLPPPASGWTQDRDFPVPARHSFHDRQKSSAARGLRSEKPLPASPIDQEPAEVSPPRQPDPPPMAESSLGLVDHFIAELQALGAETRLVRGRTQLIAAISRTLAPCAGQTLVRWRHPELEDLGLDELAAAAGVRVVWPTSDSEAKLIPLAAEAAIGVTSAHFALADSGTIVLVTAPGQERAISLLPPTHLAIIKSSVILPGVEPLFAAIADSSQADPRGLTFITGPSRTADIELVTVIGVHGPKQLIVIIEDDRPD